MPILKYRCNSCGKEFPKILVDPAQAPSGCPVCGAVEIEELGAAFNAENVSLERLLCQSCDSCGVEGGCGIPQR